MRAVSFGEGFVDISMYVVPGRPSKNAACMQPDYLRHIFRKLRLAVFERMCRLPIGLGSLWARSRGRFPILRCRMSGIASGIVATAAPTALLSPSQSQPYSGLILAGRPVGAGKSERESASIATRRAGRAYYIYVASRHAKCGISAGNPNGGFGRPITFASASASPKQEQTNREVGAIAPLRLGLKCPLGRAPVVARQAR
jgi:hypothetical protein